MDDAELRRQLNFTGYNDQRTFQSPNVTNASDADEEIDTILKVVYRISGST